MRRRLPLLARFSALLGPDAAGVRQSLVALALNSSTSLIAGAILGAITVTLTEQPGLLVLIPAAIGLRGNVFGAFGNRLSTAMHTGTFRPTLRRGSVLHQNVVATGVLTASLAVVIAGLTTVIASGFDLGKTIPFVDLSLVSVVGGVLASTVVLVAALGLTMGAVRYGWDLDNVTAPIVSTLGDVLTLPALLLATLLLDHGTVTDGLGWVVTAAAVAVLGVTVVTQQETLRRIVRESLPVLALAGGVSTLAGVVFEKRLDALHALPALLVLAPAHLSSAGAIGGILSGRLSSGIFLGVIEPKRWPARAARRDIWFVLAIAAPVYLFNGIGAHVVGRLLDQASPGLAQMLGVSLLGGAVAVIFVVVVAYASTVASLRLGLDPDTHGIPLVSSSVDFVGALALVLSAAALGVI